jgi:SAM-dependent methyltransferase
MLRLYSDLATWWPLFSPPSEYVGEAADLLPALLAAPDAPPATMLELGSGGGSLAFQLKAHLQLTLSDISPQMLAVSRAVNPECEHVQGDMRDLRLGRAFDLVLVHDAITYAADEASARATIETAARHCRPGGAVMIVPDCVRETFEPQTSTGGEDQADGRGLRYLTWTWDPDPGDDTYEEAFALMLRQADGGTSVDHDRHRLGLFPRAAWLAWMRAAGLVATSRIDPWGRDVFLGTMRERG